MSIKFVAHKSIESTPEDAANLNKHGDGGANIELGDEINNQGAEVEAPTVKGSEVDYRDSSLKGSVDGSRRGSTNGGLNGSAGGRQKGSEDGSLKGSADGSRRGIGADDERGSGSGDVSKRSDLNLNDAMSDRSERSRDLEQSNANDAGESQYSSDDVSETSD